MMKTLTTSIPSLIARSLLLLTALLALPASALDRVTLQLNSYHQFEYAGYYAALAQGYYQQAGLDVSINESQMGTDPIIEVISGKAEFGVSDSSLLLSRASGRPVVVLATIFQHSPAVLISRPRAKGQGLQALAGKRIMLDTQADEVSAMLKKEGLLNRITRVDPSYDPQDLIKGKVDAMSGSLLNETWLLDRASYTYQIDAPLKDDIDFYGDNLYTSESMIKDQGDKVQAFREASLRGWTYALAHPDEIADLIRSKYSQRREREFQMHQSTQIARLIDADTASIGTQTPERWKKIGDVYKSLGKIDKDVALDAFLFNPSMIPKKVEQKTDYKLIGIIGGGAALAVLLFAIVSFRLARVQFALRVERQRQGALQEQIRINEERYRGLFNSMDNGFSLNEIICDTDGTPIDYRIVEVNPAFEKVSGFSREKLMGKRAKEVFQEGVDDWLEQFGTVVKTGQPQRFEKFSQQTCRWFSTDAYSPSPNKFAVVTQEITERKQMEIALTKANTDLREKFEEIKRLQEKLQEQAVRDPLTGLHNRRYLDETLRRELSRARRENYLLCVILLDLDFFKKINDGYGHLAGDEVLKVFAKILHDHAREGDVACRYGGEEFMLMLPKMPVATAIARANKLRETFAATKIPFGEHPNIGTTLSIGIAFFPMHGDTPDELTNNADKALYIAKHEGRNRAILYTPEESQEPEEHMEPIVITPAVLPDKRAVPDAALESEPESEPAFEPESKPEQEQEPTLTLRSEPHTNEELSPFRAWKSRESQDSRETHQSPTPHDSHDSHDSREPYSTRRSPMSLDEHDARSNHEGHGEHDAREKPHAPASEPMSTLNFDLPPSSSKPSPAPTSAPATTNSALSAAFAEVSRSHDALSLEPLEYEKPKASSTPFPRLPE